MLNNINEIIKRETMYAVKSILEGSLNSDKDERSNQEDMAALLKKRGLKASDDKTSEKNEAEDELNVKDEEKRKDRTGGKGTADSPKIKTPSKTAMKEPTLGSIVDKLNTMRGGKSLKDPEVKKSFEQYFEGLTNTERQTLLIFLTGIAQILAGTKAGDEALEPADVGLRVGATDKRSQVLDKESDPGKPEGHPENPIVVGEASRAKMAAVIAKYKMHQ